MTMRIKPIFKANGCDYAFDPILPGLPKGSNTEFRFIIDTLRVHLGDDLYFTEENGIFTLLYTADDLDIVKKINADSEYCPVKYGQCYLRFEILEISNEEI